MKSRWGNELWKLHLSADFYARGRDIRRRWYAHILSSVWRERARAASYYEKSCGAVIYRHIGETVRYLLIKNRRSSNWSFPKGHVEDGETLEETAKREVLEETGIHLNIFPGFVSKSQYTIQNKIQKNAFILKYYEHMNHCWLLWKRNRLKHQKIKKLEIITNIIKKRYPIDLKIFTTITISKTGNTTNCL